jgi:hypothetical protein
VSTQIVTTRWPTGPRGAETLPPAARLELAITRLTGIVALATKGPWRAATVHSPNSVNTSAVYSHGHQTGTAESEVVSAARRTARYGGGIRHNHHNATYIATFDPAAGTEVLGLLRLLHAAYGQTFDDAVAGRNPLACQLLAVADAFLDGS